MRTVSNRTYQFIFIVGCKILMTNPITLKVNISLCTSFILRIKGNRLLLLEYYSFKVLLVEYFLHFFLGVLRRPKLFVERLILILYTIIGLPLVTPKVKTRCHERRLLVGGSYHGHHRNILTSWHHEMLGCL